MKCYRMFGSSGACAACGQAIPASEFVMRTNAPQQPLHVFHIKCFACSKCGSHLMQGDRYDHVLSKLLIYSNVLFETNYEQTICACVIDANINNSTL